MATRMKQVSGVLILLVLSAGTSNTQLRANAPSQEATKVPYCEVLSKFEDYDGKMVMTTAFAGVSFHSDALFDPACMSSTGQNRSVDFDLPDGWNSTKLGKKLENVFRQDRIARITFQGTFHSSKQQYGGDGARFRFTMHKLVSVEKVSKKEASLLR